LRLSPRRRSDSVENDLRLIELVAACVGDRVQAAGIAVGNGE
jgi:hypothetical protein